MMFLRTKKVRSISWWQCLFKKVFFLEINTFKAACTPNFPNFTGENVFRDRLFLDVTDRFAIKGYKISRRWQHLARWPQVAYPWLDERGPAGRMRSANEFQMSFWKLVFKERILKLKNFALKNSSTFTNICVLLREYIFCHKTI